MNEKAWNDGSAGPPISGQTLERATGLVLPSNTPHFSSVTTYFLLNSKKPVSVNWPGERNSQAQNDVSGRPRSRISLLDALEALHERHRLAELHALDLVARHRRDSAGILERERQEAVVARREVGGCHECFPTLWT